MIDQNLRLNQNKSSANRSNLSIGDITDLNMNFNTLTSDIAQSEQERRFLERANINEISNIYNQMVAQRTELLTEQYKTMHTASDLAYASQMRSLGENAGTESSGMQAILSQRVVKGKEQVDTTIDEQLMEAKIGMQEELVSSFEAALTGYLGKLDPKTGQYSGLADYTGAADRYTSRLFDYAAGTLMKGVYGPEFDRLYETQGAEAALAFLGVLTKGIDATSGLPIYEFNEHTQFLLHALVGGSYRDAEGLGVQYNVAKLLAIDDAGGLDKFESKDMRVQQDMINNWYDWIAAYGNLAEYTHLDLFNHDDAGNIIQKGIFTSDEYDLATREDIIDSLSERLGFELPLGDSYSVRQQDAMINITQNYLADYKRQLNNNSIQLTGKTIDIQLDTTKTLTEDFKLGKGGTEQTALVDATLAQLKGALDSGRDADNIGKLVILNYGNRANTNMYVYSGNGVLVEVRRAGEGALPLNKMYKTGRLFVPSGYKFNNAFRLTDERGRIFLDTGGK